MSRTNWQHVCDVLAETISASGTAWTLRQAYYAGATRLGLFPIGKGSYKQLSKVTAQRRREGTFPALIDSRERMHGNTSGWESVADFLDGIEGSYVRDVWATQPSRLIVAVEKDTLRRQVSGWVDQWRVPVLSLGGYGSQSAVDALARLTMDWGDSDQRTHLIYVGDFDASGEDVERDLSSRGFGFTIDRLLLTFEQTIEWAVPWERPDWRREDTRWAAFADRYGFDRDDWRQWEVEALDPAFLRGQVLSAVESSIPDAAALTVGLDREADEAEALREFAQRWSA